MTETTPVEPDTSEEVETPSDAPAPDATTVEPDAPDAVPAEPTDPGVTPDPATDPTEADPTPDPVVPDTEDIGPDPVIPLGDAVAQIDAEDQAAIKANRAAEEAAWRKADEPVVIQYKKPSGGRDQSGTPEQFLCDAGKACPDFEAVVGVDLVTCPTCGSSAVRRA